MVSNKCFLYIQAKPVCKVAKKKMCHDFFSVSIREQLVASKCLFFFFFIDEVDDLKVFPFPIMLSYIS